MKNQTKERYNSSYIKNLLDSDFHKYLIETKKIICKHSKVLSSTKYLITKDGIIRDIIDIYKNPPPNAHDKLNRILASILSL